MNTTHINYQEYLESYAWKALKKTKLEEQPDCESCGLSATSVHHLSYERLGREKSEDIVSICERCHEECHHVGGYQIKNDEEILRRRFEEVKGVFGEVENGEFLQSGEDYYLNGERLQKLLDLSIIIREGTDEMDSISALLQSKTHIYCLRKYSSWCTGPDGGSSGYDPYEGYASAPEENDGSWHPAYEGYGCFSDDIPEDHSEHNEYMKLNLVKMTTVWEDCKIEVGSSCVGNSLERINLDAKSFQIIHTDSDSEEKFHVIYIKDKNNVYRNFCLIKGADSATFEIISKQLSKDKDHVYYYGKKIEESDSSTFEVIDNTYSKDKNNVYFKINDSRYSQPFKIEGADFASFKIISNQLSNDKHHVYYYGKKIEESDSSTFEVIDDRYGKRYSKDKNNVYYDFCLIKGADSATFEFIDDKYSKDKNHVYCTITRKGKPLGYMDELIMIEESDSSTFEIINSQYSKDKNNVYFNGYKEDNLDGKTFEIIDSHYGKDKNHVYGLNEKPPYNYEILTGIDTDSFEKINSYFQKDKFNFYFWRKRLNLDDDSIIIGTDSIGDHYHTYNYKGEISEIYDKISLDLKGRILKNSKFIYYFSDHKLQILDGADAESFIFIDKDCTYAKDKTHAYYFSEMHSDVEIMIIDGAELSSFIFLGENFAKDKNHVYRNGKILEGIDPDTFEVIDKRYLKDKNHVYKFFGEILEGIDPDTFEVIDSNYWKDKNHVYNWEGKILEGEVLKSGRLYDRNYDYYSKDGIKRNLNMEYKLIDPEGFEVIDERYLKDKNNVYYYFNRIKIIPGADPESFEISVYKDLTKDKNHVFLRGEIADYIDVDSLEKINENISKDKNHVFYNYEIINGADSKSFKKIFEKSSTVLYKDKNHIYEYKLDGLFEITDFTGKYFSVFFCDYTFIHKDHSNLEGRIFKPDFDSFIHVKNNLFKDNFGIWLMEDSCGCLNFKITGIDLASFQIIEFVGYRDTNYLYVENPGKDLQLIDYVDLDTFEVINETFAKDKNNVFYLGRFVKMEDTNPESFKIINDCYTKDKKNVYFRSKAIKGADPESITAFDGVYRNWAQDKNYIYCDGYRSNGANIEDLKSSLKNNRRLF